MTRRPALGRVARRWLRFRTDAFLLLNAFDAWLGTLTDWMDRPGPSADDIEMQPTLPPEALR